MAYDNNQPVKSPEETRLIKEFEKAQKILNETSTHNIKLTEAIKTLAAQNRRDGDSNKIAYTNNVLALREFQEREGKNMSGYAKEIAASIEKVNTDNRKISKSEQRANLKQLDRLTALTDTVSGDDEREKLIGFIDDSKNSILKNASKTDALVSGVLNHMDVITGAVTGLFSDSPLMAMMAGFAVNKTTEALKSRRETQYQVQEGRERQLSEELGNQIAQEDALNDIAIKLDDIKNKPESEEPIKIDLPKENGPVVTTENNDNKTKPEIIEPIINNNSQDTDIWLEGIYDIVDDLAMDVMEISESLNKPSISELPENVSFKMDTETLVKSIDNIAEILYPLMSHREEDRREENVYREQLLDKLEQSPQVANLDGSEREEDSGTGIIGGALSLGMSGILGNFVAMAKKSVFKGLKLVVKSLPKVLGKIFLPVMIISTLFSGVMEAVDIFTKTGSIKDAAIGFFGGMLDFLTFGFFGTEELNGLINLISEYIDPIKETLTKPFVWIADKASTLWDSFDIDALIPDIDFMPSDMKDKLLSLGDKFVTLLSPVDMIIDLMGKIAPMFKEQIKSVVSHIPDALVPDSLVEWLDEGNKPVTIEKPKIDSTFKEQFAGSPESMEREKLTDKIIETKDKLDNKTEESSQTSNTNIVDNSNNSRTVIQHSAPTAHDPNMMIRFQYQSGFGF